jgi:hypothetical protein
LAANEFAPVTPGEMANLSHKCKAYKGTPRRMSQSKLAMRLRASKKNFAERNNVKNITVTVDDETYRRARIKAAERDTVSALVARFLTELAAGEN